MASVMNVLSVAAVLSTTNAKAMAEPRWELFRFANYGSEVIGYRNRKQV